MASSAKDARAIKSGAALRDALLSLLKRKTFDQITVRDISAEAGVHYATFFRHHPSKEALLDHIAAEQIETVVDLSLPVQESAGYAAGLQAVCRYIESNRSLWSVLLNGGAGQAMRAEWLQRARTVAKTHPHSSWLPKDLGTICSVSLLVEGVAWWLAQPEEEYSADAIAGIIDRLVSSSILGDAT